MKTYRLVGPRDSEGIAFTEGTERGWIQPGSTEWDEYLAWKLAGKAPAPDPEWTLEKTQARALESLKAAGTQALETGGYAAWKQSQMILLIVSIVIAKMNEIIAQAKLTVDMTELATVSAAVSSLTDLTFAQTVSMAAEIAKVRSAVNAGETAISAATTPEAAMAIAKMGVTAPKPRKEIEAGVK